MRRGAPGGGRSGDRRMARGAGRGDTGGLSSELGIADSRPPVGGAPDLNEGST
jgi:hypothetical protein